MRRSAVLLSLALGTALSAMVGLAGTAPQAEAAFTEKIVFISNRATGTGVDNPTGDYEIFSMNPDGSGVKQLTFNDVNDSNPDFAPDGQKIAYQSWGVQSSNPEGDVDIYRINALDGSGKRNLTNNGLYVEDTSATFSPDGAKVLYESYGAQTSNLEGDAEIYRMNTLDGKGKKNLSNTASGVSDIVPDFSPDGTKVTYVSSGVQSSNTEGDFEVYRMNSLDGSGQTNLTNDPATDGAFVIRTRR
jgi:Tol biopolymer transport system component